MAPEPMAWLVAHLALASLVLARAAGLAWTAPVLAAPGLGPRYRLGLAAAIALVVAPAVVAADATLAAAPAAGSGPDWRVLGVGWVVEAMVGAALGWTAALVIAGAREAGDLVASQAGLSSAALFDPETGDEATALGHLYGLVALGVFLGLDGPLVLVRSLAESYQVVPAGGVGVLAAGPEVSAFALSKVGAALALALRVAAPVALALALAGVVLGLIARASPSFQRAALTLPVRATLGLLLVLATLAAVASALGTAWSAWPASLLAWPTGPGGP